ARRRPERRRDRDRHGRAHARRRARAGGARAPARGVASTQAEGDARRAREVRAQRLVRSPRCGDGVTRLDGKVALVTGGSSGIGRAIALGFAREGALVHVNHVDDAGDVLAQLGDASLDLRHDVSDREQVAAMFARLDRLDVLVNCAGITGWAPFLETDAETFDRVLGTNLRGTFFCSLEVAKLMRAGGRGGSIVNVSSVVGARGMRNL